MRSPCRILMALASLCASTADARTTICNNGQGTHDGFFYTFFRDTGHGCITLGDKGSFSTTWDLGSSGNLVAGKGWATGSTTRVIGYHARAFDPGTNGYLTLYGWTRNPLIEYYVVDSWGSNFTPPGGGVTSLGTVVTDGGVYRIYRTQRINQPSIEGIRTFYQYWSVRTARRTIATNNTITFANHVGAWRNVGLILGAMDYQIVATEGFGSVGRAKVTVWQQ